MRHDHNVPAKKTIRSQRQLKVGEEIRHILSRALVRDDFYDPDFADVSVTISEVMVNPDFSAARVYCVPLGGHDPDKALAAMARIAPKLQHQLAQQLTTKRSPKLRFFLDTSFEVAGRVASLIERNKHDIDKIE